MSEDTTSNAVPADAEGSKEAASADAQVHAQPSIKDVLGQVLGKQFDSDDAALKSVKDTYSFVGKAGSYQKHMKVLTQKFDTDELGVINKLESFSMENEQVTQQTAGTGIASEVQQLKAQLEETTFFAEHPELKEHKDLLREVRGTSGKSYTEVVEMPAFKNILEKAHAAEAMEREKSVLQSNPRLGQVRDKLSEAREAAKAGNIDVARSAAVGAVLEAFES